MQGQPTYLVGLGATKAGTSWLYDQLAGHPDCHFRTIKELHYFDTAHGGAWDGAIRATNAKIARLTDLMAAQPETNQDYRRRHLADLTDWLSVLRSRMLDLPAYLSYLAQGMAAGTRLVGEITPSYALLPGPRLAEVQAMAPDVRFVYLMRDPVDRLWSHVRMIAARAAPLKEVRHGYALDLLRALCRGETAGEAAGIVARGDYRAALSRMAQALDPSRLLVLFQEALIQPAGLDPLTDFLGLRRMVADFARKVHEGVSMALPARDRAMARAFLAPQYDFVGARFGHLPPRWRDNLEGDGHDGR